MKTLRFVLMALVMCIITSGLQAQTAEEIISKYKDAVGGNDILSKIKSVYMEGVASVMGNDLPTTVNIVNGKGFKTETFFNGVDIIQCFTDTSGWMVNPVQGQPNPVALPAAEVGLNKFSLDMRGQLYNYQDNGFTDSLIGREDYQGVSVYKLKLGKTGVDIIYFIDPTTFYVLKKEVHVSVDGKNISRVTTFSNYKKTDFGYVAPFTTGINNMGYDVTLNYTKVEINKEIDPKIFAMPR